MLTIRPEEPLLASTEGKRVHPMVVTLLYLFRGTEFTMLTALNKIGTQQASPTHKTTQHVNRIIDYTATNKSVTIQFHKKRHDPSRCFRRRVPCPSLRPEARRGVLIP